MSDSIFAFGRTEAERRRDALAGVARFNGFFTRPNYARSYIKAATTLFRSARDFLQLEEVALPLLYLQRHALELVLKEFVSLLAGVGRINTKTSGTD